MGRRILHLDVLGEVRRAQRILRRVEKYLTQKERDAKRAGVKRVEREQRERQRVEPGDL